MDFALAGISSSQTEGDFFLGGPFSATTGLEKLNSAKEEILSRYINIFNKNNELNGEVDEKFFKHWDGVSEGEMAKLLEDSLSEALNNDISLTGAGFQDRVLKLLGKTEMDSVVWNDDTAQKILEGIREKLQLYLQKLEEAEEWYGYSVILDLYNKAGGTGLSIPQRVEAKDGLYRGKDLKEGDTKFKGLITDLSSMIEKVNSPDKTSPQELVKSLTSSFSAIGGEFIFEPLAALCANAIKKDVKDGILDKAEDAFIKNGYSVKANWVSSDTTNNGKQVKPDIQLEWTNGTIKVSMGGSIKLRQKASNVKGSYTGTINPQSSYTLGQMLAQTVSNDAIKSVERGWSAILVSPDGDGTDYVRAANLVSYTQAWNTMKEYGKYVAAFRTIVGSGDSKDFAGIFIVNNKVYSTYSLIEKAFINTVEGSKKLKNQTISISGKGYTTSYPTFSKYYKTKWQSNDSPLSQENERKKEFQELVKAIYSKKITITIRLANLLKAMA